MFNKKLFLAVSFSALVLSQPSNAVIGPIKITLNPTELSSNYFNGDDVYDDATGQIVNYTCGNGDAVLDDTVAVRVMDNDEGYGYAVFGAVLQGMDIVDKIAALETAGRASFNKDVPVDDVTITSVTRI